MRLTFFGANRNVTGSRTCLDAGGQQVLIDCGLVQERPFLDRNWDPCPLPAQEIDALLLTHVHIDHSGLIPRLVREGFRGPIYATRASVELLEVVLRDAAKIQGEDVEYKRKRHRREGRKGGAHPNAPLYTDDDVNHALALLETVKYGEPVQINPAMTATYFDAGHVVGSAMIQVDVTENEQSKRFVFSGDIGQPNRPLIRDPSFLPDADYIVMESTYGDRLHDHQRDVESQLAEVVNTTIDRGGKVVIPTFAVERAQELMYYFSRLVRAGRVPPIRVFLDSPMAVDVTEIYRGLGEFFDAETLALLAAKQPPLRFPGLTMARTANESKSINHYKQPCVIMASSGMCTAGRIKHHLRATLGDRANTILFVGYQSSGTLGRQILEGADSVRIHGGQYQVRAEVRQIYGFSGHADRDGLLDWLKHFRRPPARLFLNHGEEQVALKFAAEIERDLKFPVSVPEYGETFEL